MIYKILYKVLFVGWFLISKMPACIHYFNSTCAYYLVYYIIRYRRKIVKDNLTTSFPDKSKNEILRIEKDFYRHFCDIIVESIMYFGMSQKEIQKRMIFTNLDGLRNDCINGRSVAIYMGHFGNWEWVSSIALEISDISIATEIYHPLKNKVFDRLIGYTRQRFGSKCIPVDESVRHIVRYIKSCKPIVIGFISDQTPRWNNIHLWLPFLNHSETPVFTGAERLTKKFNMTVYYLDLKQVRRGYYEASLKLISEDPKNVPGFGITEQYTKLLEETIRETPYLWLWSQNRWKRTKAEWGKKYGEIQNKDYAKKI